MFTKSKPGPARDLSEMTTGDPWEVGNISDAPSPEDVNADLLRYDQHLDALTMAAGVVPGSPAWEPTRDAIEAQHTYGPAHGEFPRHGDPLPMTARQAIAHSPQSFRDDLGEHADFQDDLWNEYRSIWPQLAADPQGTTYAVDHVLRERRDFYHEDPSRYVRERRTEFLQAVAMAQELGHGRPSPYSADSGRTSGIGAGNGGFAPEQHSPLDSDQSGMVGELREIQRRRGW